MFISLSHFKGHELTGFGGCFKNIGMGCGSRAGKMEQHNSGKPSVDQSVCVGCRVCSKNCAHGAISFPEKKAYIDHAKCVGCGRCLGACNFDAIYNENSSAVKDLNMKMAEYTKAVVDGRPAFHINLVIDVSPYCDCHPENDVPSCRISGCSRALTQSHWTRRARTRAMHSSRCGEASWTNICMKKDSVTTTTISQIQRRRASGRHVSHMQKRSGLGAESTN